MTTTNIILIIIATLLSFLFSHLFMKKGMILDDNWSEDKYRDLTKFFYVPFLNIIVTFFYLVWMVIIFKRSE